MKRRVFLMFLCTFALFFLASCNHGGKEDGKTNHRIYCTAIAVPRRFVDAIAQ